MRQDSIEFGVERGVSIPIHGPCEDFAIFLVSQRVGENCLENWNSIEADIFSAAYYYYFSVQKILMKNIKPLVLEHLNARELQCLTLISQQYTTDEIAKKLSITPRTVNFHIQRMNKKLGTDNKYQSVIKALKKGFISL